MSDAEERSGLSQLFDSNEEWVYIGTVEAQEREDVGDNTRLDLRLPETTAQEFGISGGDTIRVRVNNPDTGDSLIHEHDVTSRYSDGSQPEFTLPKRYRQELGIRPGDTILWYLHEDSPIKTREWNPAPPKRRDIQLDNDRLVAVMRNYDCFHLLDEDEEQLRCNNHVLERGENAVIIPVALAKSNGLELCEACESIGGAVGLEAMTTPQMRDWIASQFDEYKRKQNRQGSYTPKEEMRTICQILIDNVEGVEPP